MRYLLISCLWVVGLAACQGQPADSTEQEVPDTLTAVGAVEVPAVDSLAYYKGLADSLRTLADNKVKALRWLSRKNARLEENVGNLIQNTKSFGWRVKFQNKYYDTYVVDIDAVTLKLYHRDKKGRAESFRTLSKKAKNEGTDLAFAMNAGMFKKDRTPLGCYIVNGELFYPTNFVHQGYGNFFMQFTKNAQTTRPTNGIFLVSRERGAAVIFPDSLAQYQLVDLLLATQSGPVMLKDGKINEHFRKGSPNLNIRNGVGIIDNKKIVFAISREPVNFYEFTEFFKTFYNCTDALYLDGVVSQMYAPELGRIQENGEGLGPLLGVIR